MLIVLHSRSCFVVLFFYALLVWRWQQQRVQKLVGSQRKIIISGKSSVDNIRETLKRVQK